MNSLATLINALEVLLYIALPTFIVSTLYLISVVKKSKYDLVKKSVTNPIFPNLDLGFFPSFSRNISNVGETNSLLLQAKYLFISSL